MCVANVCGDEVLKCMERVLKKVLKGITFDFRIPAYTLIYFHCAAKVVCVMFFPLPPLGSLEGALPGECAPLHHHQLGEGV